VLHLAKQRAYFPEQRRFSESSIAVPLSAAAAARLAAGCRRLRALHLCLGASDVTPEGLAELRRFSSLKRWGVGGRGGVHGVGVVVGCTAWRVLGVHGVVRCSLCVWRQRGRATPCSTLALRVLPLCCPLPRPAPAACL
jgi:hypothetical protein